MPYTRALKYTFPIIGGGDVLMVQKRLQELGYSQVGRPDGIFGNQTDLSIRAFQKARNLEADGIVGPLTWSLLFGDSADTALEKVKSALNDLSQPHGFRDSVTWQLSSKGILINNSATPETSGGEPKTVRGVWSRFQSGIELWSEKFGVPVELIISTMCTETNGDPSKIRKEPGYVSDEQTPNKISPGLMQTLISTARNTLGESSIDRAWLLVPENSIRAGTAYIASQWGTTHFDPPKVACAYNAGGVYHNDGAANRWKMRQYPINSAEHADRFVKWFNDCFIFFAADKIRPKVSFYRLMTTS